MFENVSLVKYNAKFTEKNISNLNSKLSIFKRIFLFEGSDINLLEEEIAKKSHFLPMAADTDIYYPMKNIEKDIDISFVGNLSDFRLNVLFKVIDSFPNARIKIYGKRFITRVRPLDFYLRKRGCFIHKNLSSVEVNNIYNRSKVCLNIVKEQSNLGINPRFFEILATKSIQVVNRNKYIDNYFGDYNIQSFTNDNEMIEIIAKCLDSNIINDSEKIYQEIMRNHTFENRIKEFLCVVQ